jgi:TIR domain
MPIGPENVIQKTLDGNRPPTRLLAAPGRANIAPVVKPKRNAKPLGKKPTKAPAADPEGPNVFISWSGPRSKPAAEAFRHWLKEKIGPSRPWTSSVDIPLLGSSEWRGQILDALESSQICVSFLTIDNLKDPWLLFEAGAVVQRMRREQKRTIALVLLDLKPGDVEEPLVAYQLTPFTRDGLSKLVGEINAQVGDPSYSTSVKDSFDKDWPTLERAMTPEPLGHHAEKRNKRDQGDILAELLQKVRTIEHAVLEGAKSRERLSLIEGIRQRRSLRPPPDQNEFAAGLVEQWSKDLAAGSNWQEAARAYLIAEREIRNDPSSAEASKRAQLAKDVLEYEVAVASLSPLSPKPGAGKKG